MPVVFLLEPHFLPTSRRLFPSRTPGVLHTPPEALFSTMSVALPLGTQPAETLHKQTLGGSSQDAGFRDFPGGSVARIPHSQYRGPRFNPWLGN